MNSPENVPPKPRYWRIVLGIIIIVLKLIQYTTVGIFELSASGTPAYRIGALVGDVMVRDCRMAHLHRTKASQACERLTAQSPACDGLTC